jgi:hypothetical protein
VSADQHHGSNGNGSEPGQRRPGRPRIYEQPPERLTLYLPPTLVGIMDSYRMEQSRSQFVRKAIEHWLGHVERRLRGEGEEESAESE